MNKMQYAFYGKQMNKIKKRKKLKLFIFSVQNDANSRKETKIQSLKGRGSPLANSQPQMARLLKEIETLKEANKCLASKVQVNYILLIYSFRIYIFYCN